MPVESTFNLLSKMAIPQIIILGCLSTYLNLTIPVKVFHNLSQFKFDGKGELTLREHLFQVVHVFYSNGIHCKDVIYRFLTLEFEGRVKRWCHTLPVASIHSFDQLAKSFIKPSISITIEMFVEESIF